MNPAIVMYAKTTCPYCHAAERLLRERGVSRIEMILIDEQPRRRPEMIDRSSGARPPAASSSYRSSQPPT